MFEMLSMVQALGGVSSLLIAGSVAIGGTVALTVFRKPLRNRLRPAQGSRAPRRSPLVRSSRIRPDRMDGAMDGNSDRPLPLPDERVIRRSESAYVGHQDSSMAREKGASVKLGTMCPPELSRRIDELELKVKARGAGS